LYGDNGVPAAAPSRLGLTNKESPKIGRQLTGSDILNLQKQNKGALKACYERALKRDDSLAEIKAEVTVAIGDSGVVKSVNIQKVNDPSLVQCLVQNIKRWGFPAVGGQTISFPILFRGS